MAAFIAKYNGIEITFNSISAEFEAIVKKKKIYAGSLAGIKKKIEKEDSFKSFAALYLNQYGNSPNVKLVKVIGIRAVIGGYSRGKKEFETDDGDRQSMLIVDTEENRRLCKEYIVAIKKRDAECGKLREQAREIHEKITFIDAFSYGQLDK